MSEPTQRTTSAKALRVNLDLTRYGAFAEIGAGQETARHFFQAGKASQTIAKSMSAYDMTYSDDIYGREKNGRYVCESRLVKMLEKEYGLLLKRLSEKRGAQTNFFAFANTVATGSADVPRCHGWLGVRFQTKPGGEFNDIVLHVRMLDRHRLQQQDALGVLGVNLIEAAFYGLAKPEEFLSLLVENIKPDQMSLDVVRFYGPDVKHFNNRSLNLELVRRQRSDAILFSPEGDLQYVSDALYGKSLLLQRGSFRPITITHLDVIEKGLAQLKRELPKMTDQKTEIVPILEIVMPKDMKAKDLKDLEDRIDLINACGLHVLISNFPLYYQLKRFMRRSTQAPMSIIVSASHLDRLFDETAYADLEGGLLEGLGKLFDEKTKLAVYPHKTDKVCVTAKLFHPEGPVAHTYDQFIEKGQIQDIVGCDEASFYYHSDEVRKMIEKKEKGWEKIVPAPAVEIIKKRKLWAKD